MHPTIARILLSCSGQSRRKVFIDRMPYPTIGVRSKFEPWSTQNWCQPTPEFRNLYYFYNACWKNVFCVALASGLHAPIIYSKLGSCCIQVRPRFVIATRAWLGCILSCGSLACVLIRCNLSYRGALKSPFASVGPPVCWHDVVLTTNKRASACLSLIVYAVQRERGFAKLVANWLRD